MSLADKLEEEYEAKINSPDFREIEVSEADRYVARYNMDTDEVKELLG